MKYVVFVGLLATHSSCGGTVKTSTSFEVESHQECIETAEELLEYPFVEFTTCEAFYRGD